MPFHTYVSLLVRDTTCAQARWCRSGKWIHTEQQADWRSLWQNRMPSHMCVSLLVCDATCGQAGKPVRTTILKDFAGCTYGVTVEIACMH